MSVNLKEAQQNAALTARWAVTMTKVRIRWIASRTRWQLVTFYGKAGAESVAASEVSAIKHVYEVRPRQDHLGVDLNSDALPFGLVWYTEIPHAIGYALHRSRSHDAVIRV